MAPSCSKLAAGMALGRPKQLFRKIRRMRRLKLGLVGSSQVRYYPLDTLEDEHLEPIILSTDPTRASEIIETGKLHEIISTTLDQHRDMDAVFIFVGGNDVRVTSDVRVIGENILTIAESFSNIGLLPIVMPLINRQYPLGIGVDQYTTIRNGVNRYLRRWYRRNGQRHNVLNFNDLKLQEDGVHLQRESYCEISRAIRIKMNIHF